MEGETNTTATFVSEKINKIRWQPVSKRVTLDSSVFATGSWDNQENHIRLWSTADKGGSDEHMAGSPKELCQIVHKGDVTDLSYVNYKMILATSSLGSIHLYRHHDSTSQKVSVSQRWEHIHQYPSGAPSPCTALALHGEDGFATVGEDGKLAIFSMEHHTPVRVIEKADSCTLNDVLYLKHNEIAAVNSTGQLKVWDLRQQSDAPVNILLLTGEKQALHCMDKHPTQPHIVVTGGVDGSLCIWDMRRQFPVNLLDAHAADMWEVRFHPTSPDNLFTCSQDGSVYHWDSCAINSAAAGKEFSTPRISSTMSLTAPTTPAPNSGWLASEASKHRMDITNVLPDNNMPVNSIDIVSNTLLCATDGEKIVTIPRLPIK